MLFAFGSGWVTSLTVPAWDLIQIKARPAVFRKMF